ncbi:MAG TPA: hypothetical protein VGK24_02875 [Candidatus Angelobacter sp.]|jgi:hypothetical protein
MAATIERQRNRAPWIALLLAVAAIFSNAIFFLGFPGQRAIPLLSAALAIGALVYAVLGIMRAFRQPQVYSGGLSASILGVVSLLICAFAAFVSIHSRDLPASAEAPRVGQKVPDFTLADTNGNKVSLEQLLGKTIGSPLNGSAASTDIHPTPTAALVPPKAVLLVFYRGNW